MPAPYDKIKLTPNAENQLYHIAQHQPDTYKCLKELFKNVKLGTTAVGPDIIYPQHHAVDGCGYTVLLSLNNASDYIQINELIFPARNLLSGII